MATHYGKGGLWKKNYLFLKSTLSRFASCLNPGKETLPNSSALDRSILFPLCTSLNVAGMANWKEMKSNKNSQLSLWIHILQTVTHFITQQQLPVNKRIIKSAFTGSSTLICSGCGVSPRACISAISRVWHMDLKISILKWLAKYQLKIRKNII